MYSLKNSCFLLFMLLIVHHLQAQTSQGDERELARTIPQSADEVNPLQEGQKIPSVSLTTPEGEEFNLNEFVKEQPSVLIFYRGGWCPYCNAHLQELMEADPQLRALGYEILAVSADKPQKLQESLEKHQMSYRLLSDTTMTAAQAFGVAFQVEDSTIKKYKTYGINLEEASGEEHHLLPVPSVFIIDRGGIIRYVYYNPNYKTRLKKEELLEQAKETL